MANLIRPHVYADPLKFYSNAQLESGLSQNTTLPGLGFPGNFQCPGLKSFYANRWQCVYNELQSLPYWSLYETEFSSHVLVFPNPSDGFIFMRSQVSGDLEWTFLNMEGEKVSTKRVTVQTGESVFLDISEISSGVYYFMVTNRGTDKFLEGKRIVKR